MHAEQMATSGYFMFEIYKLLQVRSGKTFSSQTTALIDKQTHCP